MDEEVWHACPCGEDEVEPRHWAMGFRSCLACRERAARQEAARRAMSCVPMHKSGIIYLGKGQQAVDLLRDVTVMRR